MAVNLLAGGGGGGVTSRSAVADPFAMQALLARANAEKGRAKVLADADADRQRLVQQSVDEDDAKARQLALEGQRITNEQSQYGGAPAYASSRSTATAAAPDDEMRKIELDMARERLKMMQTGANPVDPTALAALKTAAVPAAVPAPGYAVDKSVSDNAFARAKDKAGLLALRRTADARTAAAQRGITGSGIESRATEGILDDTANNLTGVATAQAEQEAQRGYDVGDRNYAGAIQQRGQELSLTPMLLSLLDRKRYY